MQESSPVNRVGTHIEGSGPPIVLLHSSMSSKHQWHELTERLRDRYRLIAIDLLGYGESAAPSPHYYDIRHEARLVSSVLERELRADERFHLIGHSYGGVVALQLAAQDPMRRLRSLSVFEPVAFHLLGPGDPDLLELKQVWHAVIARMNAGDALGGAACFVDYWSGVGAFERLGETRQLALAAQVNKVLLEYHALGEGARNVAAYGGIDVATCLISGQWSPEPAQRLISMLANIMPHASCFEVAAGHMAPITHPELVNPIFEEFIRAVEASERPPALRGSGWSRVVAVATAMVMSVGLLGLGLTATPPECPVTLGKSLFSRPCECGTKINCRHVPARRAFVPRLK